MSKIYNNFNKKAKVETSSLLLQVFFMTLGIIVLITFIKIIFLFLNLDSNTNDKISEQNANSITEFTEYFSTGKYDTVTECYSTLKLDSIENFQSYDDKNKDNFFLVLTPKSIYRINLNKKEKFLLTQDLSLGKKISEFEKEITLKKDVTDHGNLISIYGSGSYDNFITLKDLENNFYILEPIFQEGLVDKVIGEVKNKFKIQIIETVTETIGATGPGRFTQDFYHNVTKEIEGGKMVYDKNKNILFFTKGDVSNIIVSQNLCAYKHFLSIDRDKGYKKNLGRNIDYINNEIFFKIFLDDVEHTDSFRWLNGPICESENKTVSCNKLFGNNIQEYTYLEFIDTFKQYSIDKFKNDITDMKRKISFRKLSIKEIKNKNEYLDLNYLFQIPLKKY
ncbi:MAG: hypothetical protein HRU03_09140, partial [Nanoarchaeales archaeon]|nr:hypothetical protein [Nanoarchaeales archaeon]